MERLNRTRGSAAWPGLKKGSRTDAGRNLPCGQNHVLGPLDTP